MNIAIIGGGASGLFAGGILCDAEQRISIFDGNEKVGKKIYITGKGRCNLTNNTTVEEYLNNVVNGSKFMMSAINRFDCQDTINFFENNGLPLKTERGNRVFPVSDKASYVTKVLLNCVKDCDLKLNEKVVLIKEDKESNKLLVKTEKEEYLFDKVIVATGGKSYPATGSRGDGYKFAKMLGIEVVKPRSALVPIKLNDKFCPLLQGLSLKNVTLKATINGKKRELFGEMLFTNDGISGPIALSMSSYIAENQNVSLSIDLKPALSEEQLEKRLLRDFNENLNKNISYIIKGLLPRSLVSVFLNVCEIKEELKVNSITHEMRKTIIKKLKDFKLSYSNLYPLECGIVTGGGIALKEINPKSMESKKVKGLYFIGEVLDIDCLTGGFNLQTAFSTAYACATSIIEENNRS